ncbi:MAG TPA: hypothetical protein VMJ64_14890 [Anaerolineales bacterium]|nr:hypothetical protein [Anaerolineales bacterium]
MQPQKLRLGILLESPEVPAWAARAIQRIQTGDSAEFVLLALNAGSKADQHQPFIYSTFDWLDRRLFGRQPDPFAPTGIQSLLPNVPEIGVMPVHGAGGLTLRASDISAIREHELDVVVSICFESLAWENLQLAKYGVWYYYHGDDTRMTGGPAGFWEVVEGRPETGAALLAAGGEQFDTRVLYRSFFFTYPLSPARQRSYYFWAAASFLPRQLEYLHRFGERKFWQSTEEFNWQLSHVVRHYEAPSGLKALRAIGTIVRGLLKELWRRVFYLDQWFLLFSQDKGLSNDIRGFEVLRPPKDRFWADPHIVQQDGRYYIFVEELLHGTGKGHLSVIGQDAMRKWQAPVKILEKSYHLSYPSVFQCDGKYYMVPETGGNHSIDLYECVEFPHKWQFKQTLMQDVRAVDTSLVFHSGKWWLFTGMAENPAAAPNVELFLFYSEQLLGGQWTAHPQNPVISDVKRARPAGAIIQRDGKLFRPSQDCSRMYGYGIDLNEIETLSETEYCERPIIQIRPDWDPEVLATHTFASQDGLTVIDAFRRVRRIG